MTRLAIHGGAPVRSRPWAPWPEHGEPERRALERVLETGNGGGHTSPNTEAAALARELSAYVGCESTVTCANGTFSLMLALQAARLSPGAEVITTCYTFVATASAIVAAGGVPVFVDVEPRNFCIDPEQVEAAIGPRTEAILPVHLACSMADMDRLPEICTRRGLLLIEDCAHAHGARWRGRCAGAIGDFGSFSMQSSKLLTAGEGGAITTSDSIYAQRLQSLADCGRKEPGYDGFPERMLGHNLRMTEWQAAVLRAQLERLPEQHARRAERVAHFEREVRGLPGLAPLERDERNTTRTVYQLVVRYDAEAFAGVSRDAVVRALQAEGVPCSGRFYVPLYEYPLFAADPLTNPLARAGLDYSSQSFPVARCAALKETIWLPHQLFLGSGADIEDLVTALAKVQSGAASLRG